MKTRRVEATRKLRREKEGKQMTPNAGSVCKGNTNRKRGEKEKTEREARTAVFGKKGGKRGQNGD